MNKYITYGDVLPEEMPGLWWAKRHSVWLWGDTWLTGVPAGGLQPRIRKCLQRLFTKNAMYELVYIGRPADRHKFILVNSKIYMAILRKSILSIF